MVIKRFCKYLIIFFLRLYLRVRAFTLITLKIIPILNKLIKPTPIGSSITLMITYKCNLMCFNCNSLCYQAPSKISMSTKQIIKFIDESILNKIKWESIRLSGGEPTLHKNLFEIIDILLDYKKNYSPRTTIILLTNGTSKYTSEILGKIPEGISIQMTYKSSKVQKYHPINLAPRDNILYKYVNYSLGCWDGIMCGPALSPFGYYSCPYQPAYDRVLGFNLGKKDFQSLKNGYLEINKVLCSYCGALRMARLTYKQKYSKSWIEPIKRYKESPPVLDLY